MCYEINPKRGIIPANGVINIKIKFTPVTLGTCITKIQLMIGQHNFMPLECEIFARAVSGVIESNELLKAEKRILNYVLNTGYSINNKLGESTFRGDLTTNDQSDFTKNFKVTVDRYSIPKGNGLKFNATKYLEVYMYVYIYIWLCICVYVYMYAYICTYIYMYIYVCVHIY
jgi:hypothetical protein